MDVEFELSWERLVKKISSPYGEELDVQAILFLIGIQELGHGYRKFTKDQKLDVLHIAVCTLLSQYGYYEYEGRDADNWPHWKATEKLPNLKPLQQNHLMRQAIVEYFRTKDSEI